MVIPSESSSASIAKLLGTMGGITTYCPAANSNFSDPISALNLPLVTIVHSVAIV